MDGTKSDVPSDNMARLKLMDEINKVNQASDFRTKGHCAACGTAATTRCNGCSDAPDLDDPEYVEESTFYCSKSCQVKHWPQHKKTCNKLQQRILVRQAAHFLQGLWLCYRRCAIDMDIKAVKVQGDLVSWVEGDYQERMSERWLRAFPSHLTTHPEIEAALLAYRSCNEALVWLCPMLEDILGDRCKKIEQVCSHVKNVKLRVRAVTDTGLEINSANVLHVVWKITLKSGETWTIDPTALQFGWQNNAISYNNWIRNRSMGALRPSEHYKNYEEMLQHRSETGNNSDVFTFYQWHEELLTGRVMFIHDLPTMFKGGSKRGRDDAKHVPVSMNEMFKPNTRALFPDYVTQVLARLNEVLPGDLDAIYEQCVPTMRMNVLRDVMDQLGLDTSSEAAMKKQEAAWLKQTSKPKAHSPFDPTGDSSISVDEFSKNPEKWAELVRKKKEAGVKGKPLVIHF